jgi:hypothetical protein
MLLVELWLLLIGLLTDDPPTIEVTVGPELDPHG